MSGTYHYYDCFQGEVYIFTIKALTVKAAWTLAKRQNPHVTHMNLPK